LRPRGPCEVGISLASIRRLERGKVENAPLWWYVNCAIALNVELSEVLDDELRRWHASAKAPAPPDQGFLADRWERAVRWASE
jgi:hypothetical protein